MYVQKNNSCLNFIETLSQEFNGHYFYGIEFILDEIYEEDNNVENIGQNDNSEKIDWFGLSDLII